MHNAMLCYATKLNTSLIFLFCPLDYKSNLNYKSYALPINYANRPDDEDTVMTVKATRQSYFRSLEIQEGKKTKKMHERSHFDHHRT